MIDRRLCWEIELNYVCQKLNCAYFVVKQLKSSFNIRTLVNVYYVLTYSHLSYNIIAWGAATRINRALILQKKLIKLLVKLYNLGPEHTCRN